MDQGCGCLSLLSGEFRRPHSALADFREPEGLWMPGRRSFAYFSFAVERKVRRQQAKPQNQTLPNCIRKYQKKQVKNQSPSVPLFQRGRPVISKLF